MNGAIWLISSAVRTRRPGPDTASTSPAKVRALLPHDLLDVLRKAVELVLGTCVMQCETKRAAIHDERAHRAWTELDGTVHQVLEIRRSVREHVVWSPRGSVRLQLREDIPV